MKPDTTDVVSSMSMRTGWVLSACMFALAGCDGGSAEGSDPQGTDSGDPTAGESTSDTDDLPSPYADGTAGPDDMPSLGKDRVIEAALAGIQRFIELKPSGIAAQFEALAVFEPGCPEDYLDTEQNGLRVIYFYTEGCTTSAGLHVQGIGRFERWTGIVDGDRTSSGARVSAEGGTFRLDDGTGWMQFSGYLEFDQGQYANGASDAYFYVAAEASSDAQTAQASPLLDGTVRAQGVLFSYAITGVKLLGGSGSLAGDGLGDALAISFDDLWVARYECAAEPAGSFGVRDDAGYWHDVVFDAATFPDGDQPQWQPDQCDGCGTYLVGGLQDGTLCVTNADMQSLLQWETPPC